MNKPVVLSEVAEAIDFDTHELYQFVNRKTGEIVVVNESTMRKADWEEPFDEKYEWQKEERALAEDIIVNEDNYKPIPDSYEVNDYQLMEIFIDSLNDEKKHATLAEAKDKQRFALLKTMPSQPLQEVFFRLEKAYKNFFEGRTRYPKLKNHKDYTSLTFTQFGVEKRKVKNKKTGDVNVQDVRYAASLDENNHLLISKLGAVYVNFHRPLEGKVKQVTIKRRGHRWFAIFSVERHVNETVDFPVQSTGVDVGIQTFAVLSDGTNVENPRFLLKAEKTLKRAQKKLSRMKQGSSNWKKQLQNVQRLHIKVANQRRDFLHKRSYHLSKTYKYVFVEDLKIQNMVKNRHLAKSIHDAGWGAFCQKLDYKCKNNGGALVKIKPHYTSQDCSTCGKRVKKALSVRTHVCKSCGTVLDRDHNAAINIEKVGLDLLGLCPTV